MGGAGKTGGSWGVPELGEAGGPGRSGTSSVRGPHWPLRACLEATGPGQAAVPGAEQEGPARRWPAEESRGLRGVFQGEVS